MRLSAAGKVRSPIQHHVVTPRAGARRLLIVSAMLG
jgi:hypothetical protein